MLRLILWKVWRDIMNMFRAPIGPRNVFKNLLDVPRSYVGQAGKFLAVNIIESGLELADPSIGISALLDAGKSNTVYDLGEMMTGGESDTDFGEATSINCGGAI